MGTFKSIVAIVENTVFAGDVLDTLCSSKRTQSERKEPGCTWVCSEVNVSTYRVTVLLGNKLKSGSSTSSSLLQLTLLPTDWGLCALGRSSVQLQPLVEASGPGQTWTSPAPEADSRSSISTRRPGSRGMPAAGATIVLRLDLTSAAPPPPVIPYLHHEDLGWSLWKGRMKKHAELQLNKWMKGESLSLSSELPSHPVIPETSEALISQMSRYVMAAWAHGSPLLQKVIKSKGRESIRWFTAVIPAMAFWVL